MSGKRRAVHRKPWRLTEDTVRVEGGAPPPLLVIAHLEDREVKVRRVARRVASRADVADHLSAVEGVLCLEPRRVTFEVRVVVDVAVGRVVLIESDTARLAQEQLGDLAVLPR